MTATTKFPMIIINTMLPLVITMDPNPQNLRISYEKVYSQTRTLGGWSFEHWGEKPGLLSITGRTRAMRDEAEQYLKVEAAFFTLTRMFKLDKRRLNTLMNSFVSTVPLAQSIINGSLDPADYSNLATTMIYYKYDIYKGFFSRFNWQLDAQQPRIYSYSFDFIVTGTLQDYLTDLLLSVPGTGGAAVATIFGSAVSALQVAWGNETLDEV